MFLSGVFSIVYTDTRLIVSFAVVLWLCCSGCSDAYKPASDSSRDVADQSSLLEDQGIAHSTAKECRKNICIHLQVLSPEEVQEKQRASLQKLEAMYRTNKDLVGSQTLQQRYKKGAMADSLRYNLRDIIVTVTAATIDTSKPDHEYFEIAQKLEMSIEEQSWFSADGVERSTPEVVRLYEIQPLQHKWQLLVTVPSDVVEHKNSVFHWSDKVFDTGTYSIAL